MQKVVFERENAAEIKFKNEQTKLNLELKKKAIAERLHQQEVKLNANRRSKFHESKLTDELKAYDYRNRLIEQKKKRSNREKGETRPFHEKP